jgi:c-di-GMP-binding flagellar brake protein YcgR
MKIWRTSMGTVTEGVQDDRRKFGRLRTEGTQSSMGQVVDISGGGMRVIRKGAIPVKEGERFRIDLQVDKEVLELDVQVRRITKLGRRKFEFGLEFINLSDENRGHLIRLARMAATSPRALW